MTGNFFSAASCLIRKWIWRDCTGEPPGELITSATAFAFFIEKARSSVLATPASDMPGRSGVTAPITPDSRTTGTTATPRRSRAGINARNRSIRPGNPPRPSICSAMPLPQVNYFLSHDCHSIDGTPFAFRSLLGRQGSGERHEDLSADGVDGAAFDGNSLNFSTRTALEDTSAIAACSNLERLSRAYGIAS